MAMTDAEQIKRLRAMVTRLSDALADKTMHSGLVWRDTPMGRAAAQLLADTDPNPDPDPPFAAMQETLDEGVDETLTALHGGAR